MRSFQLPALQLIPTLRTVGSLKSEGELSVRDQTPHEDPMKTHEIGREPLPDPWKMPGTCQPP